MSLSNAIRILFFIGSVVLITACGGGGGGEGSGPDNSTGNGSEITDPGLETGDSSESEEDSVEEPSEEPGATEPEAPAAEEPIDAITGFTKPVIVSLWSDDTPFGEGRIIDDTVAFSGTAEPRHIVEIWMNGALAGSTIANQSGEWVFDFSSVSLAPGNYVLEAVSVDRRGARTGAIRPFSFNFDPSALIAPSIESISDDSYVLGDGFTTDGTIVIDGLAEQGLTVRVYIDGVQVGSVLADENDTWQLDYSATDLADGTYQLTADSMIMGSVSAISPQFAVTVDRVDPPLPSLGGISVDAGSNTADRITNDDSLIFSGSAEPMATVRIRVDGSVIGSATADAGGNWSFDYQVVTLAQGNHFVELQAVDRAGNASAWSSAALVTIDTGIPAVATDMNISPDTGVLGDGITNTGAIQISGSAELDATVLVYVNGVQVGSVGVDGSGNWNLDLASSPLPNGAHDIEVQVVDLAGNPSALSPTISIVVDEVLPLAPVVAGISDDTNLLGDGVTSDNQLILIGTAQADHTVHVYVDGAQVGSTVADASGDWSFDYSATALGDGVHQVTAFAESLSGNMSLVSNAFVVTIDTVIPASPSLSTIGGLVAVLGNFISADNTVIFSGTAEPNSSVLVYLDGVQQGIASADGVGLWSFDYTSVVLGDGVYSVSLQAQDEAGNVSGFSSVAALTVDATAPVAPVINSISDDTGTSGDGITSDSALQFVGVSEANNVVSVFIDGVLVGTTTAGPTGAWSFDHVAGLGIDGIYSVTAHSTDGAGNVSPTSAAFNVTLDTVFPVFPTLDAIGSDSGSVGDFITSDSTLLLSGSAEANSSLEIQIDGIAVATVITDGAGVWAFDYSTTSLSDAVYGVTLFSSDAAANTSSSIVYYIDVDSAAPLAPVITSMSNDSGILGDSVSNDNTLAFIGTAEPGASVDVFLDGVSIGSALADGSGNWSFDHSLTILGDGSYTLSAVASDSAANASPSSTDFNFTIDTVNPAAPIISGISDDTGTISDGITSDATLSISGSAEANSTVTVYLDGVAQGSVAADGAGNWSFDNTAVSLSDASYTLTALASDLAGNSSALSAGFGVTVDSIAPSAPTVTGVSADSGALDGITNDNTLVINGTGEIGFAINVYIDAGLIGTTTVDGGGNWSFDYSGTTLLDGSYSITVTQTDAAGNTSGFSSGFAVTIDTTVPVISTLTPVDGNTNVGFDDVFVIDFNEAVFAQSGDIVIKRISDDSVVETIPVGDARVSGSGSSTITIDPSGTLFGGVGYYIEIAATAFQNASGSGFAGITNSSDWNFTTLPTAITSSTPVDETIGVALNASVTLNFNEPVFVNTGNITLRKVIDDSVWDTISIGSGQVTGSGTSTITITQTDVLEPNTAYYLNIDSGALLNGGGVPFSGIANNSDLNFMSANVSIPTVVNVTSSAANGTYGVGDTIDIQVQFSDTVNVTLATPKITLDLDVVDVILDYASGSGSDTLVFNYLVTLGDATSDLDYVATSALDSSLANIRSSDFADADLSLPTPGSAGSLGNNKDIVIDTGVIDVSSLSSADGFMVESNNLSSHLGMSVSSIGDVNGDGFEDFITGSPNENSNRGAAYVVYGQAGASRSDLLTSAISNNTNGFRIYSSSVGDYVGAAVGGAGDFNHDGYDDIYLVATRVSDYGTESGVLYIIYGKTSHSDLDISGFSAADGVKIFTSENNARLGESSSFDAANGRTIDAGGDFNGDGIDDIVLGVPQSDENGADSGKAYVLFGQTSSVIDDIDLGLILDSGPQGMLISGASFSSELGQSVSFIGDYDADGYDDVAVSAWLSDSLTTNGGEVFIVFGKPGPYFANLDVSTLVGSVGFKITSSENLGVLGHSVEGGDFNGDGISDLLISQHGYNTDTGRAHVIYGDDGGAYSTIDVDTMLSSVGFTITGVALSDRTASSIANAGDFNADGIDDMLVAAYWHDGDGVNSGAVWLISGKEGTSRSNIALSSLSIDDGIKIIGDASGDYFGQAVASADVNGDGFSDLIAGAPWGDNAASEAGETVVLWGQEFNSSNNYSLLGDTGIDNLVGTDAADTMSSGGGADAASAGAGDDVIEVSDTGFFNINGGLGNDTLRLATTLNNLDLTAIGPEVISGIEIIDLADGNNTLTLNKGSMLSLSRETSTLYVRGGSSDVVNSSIGDAWVYTGSDNVAGIDYDIYLDEGATLYIQTAVDSSGVANFSSAQQYTFDTTFLGANVAGDVTDFPVLIRISNSIRSSLQGDYDDIRFSDRDQRTWLPFEIEQGASGELYAWVLVPQVDGNSNSDYIVLHYNDTVNGSVPNGENPSRLWADYAGVWHFDEGTDGTAYDSSAYQNHAQQISSSVSTNSDKLIGHGRNFQSLDRLQVPYTPALNVDNRAFTIEAWVKEDLVLSLVFNTPSTWMSRGSGDYSWDLAGKSGFLALITPPSLTITESTFNDTNLSFNGGGFILSGSTWLHVTLVVDPAVGVRIYGDGAQIGGTGTYRNSEDGSAFLMGGTNGEQQMDEIRYGRFAADANRVRLSYQNQRSSGNLVSPKF